jgi:hypothetical protein
MMTTYLDTNLDLEELIVDLPASPTMESILVHVRRCGDKAILIEPFRYESR